MKRLYATLAATGLLLAVSTPSKAQEIPGWLEQLSFRGDLRLRYEGIHEDGEDSRHLKRYRARFAVTAAIKPDVDVVLELASGAANPVSRNVTFDGGFDIDSIGFDLAYVDWTINDAWHIFGGKMRNPLFRAGGVPLIWDGDLNPEGLAATYDSPHLFATVGAFAIEERPSAADTHLFAAETGTRFNIGENSRLIAGVGLLDYTNTVGNAAFYNGNPKGNSVDENGNYLYEYRLWEAFTQLDTRLAGHEWSFFAHWVNNTRVDVEDTGYAIGFTTPVGAGSLSWIYQDIEADAVIGTFNDSDYGGGGADSDGHILRVAYPVSRNIQFGSTLFLTSIDRFQGEEHDYTRLQVDVSFRFR